jgi:hypothetical protein
MEIEEHLPSRLPFPPVAKQHILNCSYHSWQPKYRSVTPKCRIIPVTQPFLEYLRADGIILPHDEPTVITPQTWNDADSGVYSETDADSEDDEDPAQEWRDIHDTIQQTITDFTAVVPKLNWSSPKDAVWMAGNNSLECNSADDVYLLLKSSDFVTHDLEHPFDDTVGEYIDIPYHLVLRKYFKLNPSMEFRCFVRRRKLIAICQRDMNYYNFLEDMKDDLRNVIVNFFEKKLQTEFPDENFAFDVYIPPPHKKVWLIDINPWAPRTDPLLFSWLHLLTVEGFDTDLEEDDEDEEDDIEVGKLLPEIVIVGKDDPEAYNFSTTQFSAHKLPKDVVDASRGGESVLREFADHWKGLVNDLERTHLTQDPNEDSQQ